MPTQPGLVGWLSGHNGFAFAVSNPDTVPATRLEGVLQVIQVFSQGQGIEHHEPVLWCRTIDLADVVDDLVFVEHGIQGLRACLAGSDRMQFDLYANG